MRELRFLDLIHVVIARRRSILLIVLVAVLASVGLSAVFPPWYEVKITCLMPRNAPAVGLTVSPSQEILRPMFPTAGDQELAALNEMLGLKAINELAEEIAGEKLSTQTTDIHVERSGLISISTFARDVEVGQQTTLRVYDAMNGLFRKASLENNRRVREFIETELDRLAVRRAASEEKLLEYHRQQEIVNLDQELQLLVAKRSTFADRIDQTVVALRESNGRLATLREELRKAEVEVSIEQLASSPVITELRQKIAETEVRLATSGQELTPSHPTMISSQVALKELRGLLREEIERNLRVETEGLNSIQATIQSSYINERINNEALQAERDAIEEVYNTINERAVMAPGIRTAMSQLSEDVARDRKMEQSLEAQLEEVKIQSVREMISFEILEGPTNPTDPRYPNVVGNALVSVVLALIVSLIYCVIIERNDLERERAAHGVVFLDRELIEAMGGDRPGASA